MVFAVSLTCFLANTINADDKKPTLREICVKAIKSCDGYSQEPYYYDKYYTFSIPKFQKCVANKVAETQQRTGWDIAGDIALGTAKVAGHVVIGALKLAGGLLESAVNMFSKDEAISESVGQRITRELDETFTQTKNVMVEQKEQIVRDKIEKEIARDKTILAKCSQAIKR